MATWEIDGKDVFIRMSAAEARGLAAVVGVGEVVVLHSPGYARSVIGSGRQIEAARLATDSIQKLGRKLTE